MRDSEGSSGTAGAATESDEKPPLFRAVNFVRGPFTFEGAPFLLRSLWSAFKDELLMCLARHVPLWQTGLLMPHATQYHCALCCVGSPTTFDSD